MGSGVVAVHLAAAARARHSPRGRADLYLHLFRFIGLAFIAPGVVGPGLDPRWAGAAAYGDLGAALLAGVALLLSGHGVLLRTALWAFSLWGSVDRLRALALGPRYDVPANLHAAYFIPVLGVPLLLWTHGLLFMLLLRRRAPAARRQEDDALDAAG